MFEVEILGVRVNWMMCAVNAALVVLAFHVGWWLHRRRARAKVHEARRQKHAGEYGIPTVTVTREQVAEMYPESVADRFERFMRDATDPNLTLEELLKRRPDGVPPRPKTLVDIARAPGGEGVVTASNADCVACGCLVPVNFGKGEA
jgi:hypothetical protein